MSNQCRADQFAFLLATLSIFLSNRSVHGVAIETVPVGNAGNASDTRYDASGFGAVSYNYQIGKYEVTAGQYTEFLNAVAKDDPNGLYNTAMGDSAGSFGANIQRAGTSPNFSYSVDPDWANRPVNWVSLWDAARFTNWLHNGQPIGPQGPETTENGAYHDVGNEDLFGRNVGAKFFIPTEDEWYKAAYHDKTAGLAANYFDFPMGSNIFPGNDITETTKSGNNANWFSNGYAIGPQYYRTAVGEFELSDSPYGTFDQGGNVWEWNETAVGGILLGTDRRLRGGSFEMDSFVVELHASFDHRYADPSGEGYTLGFRVASIPEPITLLLGCLAGVGLFWQKRLLRLSPQIITTPGGSRFRLAISNRQSSWPCAAVSIRNLPTRNSDSIPANFRSV
jgi:formylglycine-generating enzyme